MNDQTYDILKNWVLPVLTGGATFVLTVGKLWNIPYSEQIAGTMTALATLISFVINNASKVYFSDKEIVEATTDRNEEKG